MAGGPDYFIGVEGVSTRHAVGVLATTEGKIRSAVRKHTGMSLHATDPDELIVRLNNVLTETLRRAGLQANVLERAAVCISLTGVTFQYDRQVVLPQLLGEAEMTFGRLVCTGDAEAIFASHAQTTSGTLVLSHCGSTAYAVLSREGVLSHYRFGGWGPAIGDEGSGFWMGREVLRVIGHQHDCGQVNSLLWQEVRAWLEKPTPVAPHWSEASLLWHILVREHAASAASARSDPRTLLFAFTHKLAIQHNDGIYRTTVAGLTVPLMRAFEKGDPDAQKIVSEAVDHLARQHEGVRRRAEIQQALPVVLYGGVLNHNESIRTMLHERLEARMGHAIEPITPRHPRSMRPVMGALMFAMGGSRVEGLQLPKPALIEKLRQEQALPEFRMDLIND